MLIHLSIAAPSVGSTVWLLWTRVSQSWLSVLWGVCPELELADHGILVFPYILRNRCPVVRSDHTIPSPPQRCTESPPLRVLTSAGYLLLSGTGSHPSGCEVAARGATGVHVPDSEWSRAPFRVPWPIYTPYRKRIRALCGWRAWGVLCIFRTQIPRRVCGRQALSPTLRPSRSVGSAF